MICVEVEAALAQDQAAHLAVVALLDEMDARGPGQRRVASIGWFPSRDGAAMVESEDRWVARLTPTANSSIDVLLALSIGLDVWERHDDVLVVAANEAQLSELERRRLAHVERLSTLAEFEARARRRSAGNDGGWSV